MPTYPQWKPGDPRPDDKLLILEDTDHDGKADKCKVFYDKLHCPTGFEFWNGGVLVVDQPRLLWLKDTDGDDKADVVVRSARRLGSDDTHHVDRRVRVFQRRRCSRCSKASAMSTTVETPWGPFRRKDAPGEYVVRPAHAEDQPLHHARLRQPVVLRVTIWGQGFVGDGTTAQQHWDSPLSGAEVSGRRGIDPVFNNQGMRPCVGSEFLFSRQFPDDVQGQFIYACVINMNGMPRFEVHDERRLRGTRLMKSVPDGKGGTKEVPDDLLVSTDKNFRPVDPQIGPDGALWFGDWCNALIGHMQYSQRDPNRDHSTAASTGWCTPRKSCSNR